MVICPLKYFLLIFSTLLIANSALACFGPKLFIGTASGLEAEMRYYLVALYLHEKTGIDSVRVELAAGESASAAIANERIDLGFSAVADASVPVLLTLPGSHVLCSGKRPLESLQFSTVVPVLKRLEQRLTKVDLTTIERRIASGVLPATAVRNFMMQAGWI